MRVRATPAEIADRVFEMDPTAAKLLRNAIRNFLTDVELFVGPSDFADEWGA